MFFFISKTFWFFFQPLNLSIFLVLAGLLAGLLHRRRLSAAFCLAAVLILVMSAWSSVGALMLGPLEGRFTRPADLPERVDGIIVLGGGMEGPVNLARGGYELNGAGDRLVETAILARRYSGAKIVVSGGNDAMVLESEGDATTAPRLLTALGVAPERLLLENKSRDTYENAVFTKALVSPKPGETWLLVTSAFHMPRSVALFRKEGFAVLPWPTDHRSSGAAEFGLTHDNPTDSLQNTTLAFREWLGLFAYWISGRIDSPFPGPS